ncbi:MAG: hypothetical protein HY833_02540 [Candidatus Aenigmarchaeota archaeon]|nr:hypothetical protein [Candidatus Aenigmarchaeota archaeon]
MAKDYDPAGSMRDEPYGFGARRRDSPRFDKYSYGDNYRPPGFSGGSADYASKADIWAKRRMGEAGYGLTSASLSRAEHSRVLDEAAEDSRVMADHEKRKGLRYGGV